MPRARPPGPPRCGRWSGCLCRSCYICAGRPRPRAALRRQAAVRACVRVRVPCSCHAQVGGNCTTGD
eukprot:93071-Alexandrium_andersonii.AAC.1